MAAQVKVFAGRDPDSIKCEVVIDTNPKIALAPWDGTKGCLGGFVMYCRKNKIVLS
jgi:hypothetical protein